MIVISDINIQTVNRCHECNSYQVMGIEEDPEGRHHGILLCESCNGKELLFTLAQEAYCNLCDRAFPETELLKGFCKSCTCGNPTGIIHFQFKKNQQKSLPGLQIEGMGDTKGR